jgi:hypothetical protein
MHTEISGLHWRGSIGFCCQLRWWFYSLRRIHCARWLTNPHVGQSCRYDNVIVLNTAKMQVSSSKRCHWNRGQCPRHPKWSLKCSLLPSFRLMSLQWLNLRHHRAAWHLEARILRSWTGPDRWKTWAFRTRSSFCMIHQSCTTRWGFHWLPHYNPTLWHSI